MYYIIYYNIYIYNIYICMYVVFIICVYIYIYQISLYKHTQKAEMKMAEGIFRHAASCVMQIYGG